MQVTVPIVPEVPEPELVIDVPEGRWGWAHLQHPDPGIMQIHLMPTYDVGNHAFDDCCPCGAVQREPGFFVHNAFDGREWYFQGLRKPH